MEKQRHYPSSQSYAYSVVMYGCECWTIQKAQCWRTDAFELVLEKTLESSLNCKEIKPVNPKRNQSWIFIHWKDWCWSWNSNTLAIDAKNWLIRKDSDAGKDWSQEEKGTTRVRWLDGITELMDISWSSFGSWRWTGKPVVLRCVRLQRVEPNEQLNWSTYVFTYFE